MSFIVFDVVSGHNHARCTLNGLCQYPFYIQYCTQNLKIDFAIFFVHRSGGIVILVICLHPQTFFKSNHAKDTIEKFKTRVTRETFFGSPFYLMVRRIITFFQSCFHCFCIKTHYKTPLCNRSSELALHSGLIHSATQ